MAYHPLTAPINSGELGDVYLLHFDVPFGHATHYRGWAKDLQARITHHLRGTGARLTHHVARAGIGWSLARIWTNVDRNYERSLKNRGGAARMCPICQGRLTPAQAPHFGPLPAPVALLAA